MRNFRCLHLGFLCLRPGYPNPNGFYIAGLSISLLVTLSKPWQAHYKTYYKVSRLPAPGNQRFTGADLVICFMVDLAGVEPASRILFFLLHTVLTLTYHKDFNFVIIS